MTDTSKEACFLIVKQGTEAPERIWIAGDFGECGNYYPNAVEAEGENGGFAVEYTRADLAPVVKPLSFGRAEKSGMNLQADCAFGRYYIAVRPDGVWLWWRPASGPAHHGSATSENEAIKQCQADYKHRILSAIDMAPVARKHLSAEEAMAVTKDQYTNTLKYLSDGGDTSELLMTKAKSEPEEPMSNPGDKDYEV